MKTRVTLAIVIGFVTLPVFASAVLQVGFDELVRSSEFIFEGRVVSERAETDTKGVIRTYVTFEVMDVFKGVYSERTLALPYLGGTVGNQTMEVSDLHRPGVGERGIYFVESLARPPAHPLYGWDQGHFIVRQERTDQMERVFTRSGKPVAGFQTVTNKPAGLSTGVAAGLLLSNAGETTQGLTVLQFKQKVRELLNTR